MVEQPERDDATCAAPGCNQPTRWDMPAIIIQRDWYCSPDCARVLLENSTYVMTEIALHDPQFHADREDLPGVDDNDVRISRPINNQEDALAAVDSIEEMYPHEFRVSRDRSRANLKLSQYVKDELDEVKAEHETWDECLMRLVQLDRATRADPGQ